MAHTLGTKTAYEIEWAELTLMGAHTPRPETRGGDWLAPVP